MMKLESQNVQLKAHADRKAEAIRQVDSVHPMTGHGAGRPVRGCRACRENWTPV